MRWERPSPSGDSGAPARGAPGCAPKARRRERGAPDPPVRAPALPFGVQAGQARITPHGTGPPLEVRSTPQGTGPPSQKPGALFKEPAPPFMPWRPSDRLPRPYVLDSPTKSRQGALGAPHQTSAGCPRGAPPDLRRVPSGRPTGSPQVALGAPHQSSTGCPRGAPPDSCPSPPLGSRRGRPGSLLTEPAPPLKSGALPKEPAPPP